MEYYYKTTKKMSRGSSNIFINAFLDFTSTCFGKLLPSSGGRDFLRSYSSSLYCGCTNIWLTARPEWSVVEGFNLLAPEFGI
jgi:hypothetical protein